MLGSGSPRLLGARYVSHNGGGDMNPELTDCNNLVRVDGVLGAAQSFKRVMH